MEAVVLAGGMGSRLRSVLGDDAPKPMAPVQGHPFLEFVLAYLARHGVSRAILSVGYRREKIMQHFGERWGGLTLAYAVEETPLGTGGAIRLALQQAQSSPVFVLNGDTFAEVDLAEMQRAQEVMRARLSMAVKFMEDVSRYGRLTLQCARVVEFREQPGDGAGYVNAGLYLMDADLLSGEPDGQPFSFEQDVLRPRIAELRPPAIEFAGRFIDIGVPEDYERAPAVLAEALDAIP